MEKSLKHEEKHEEREDLRHMNQVQIHEYLTDLAKNQVESQSNRAFKVLHEVLPQAITSNDRDSDGETNWDRVYRELPALYEVDHEFARELQNIIDQDGFMVKTKIYLDTIFSEYQKDNKGEFCQLALQGVNYVFTYEKADEFNQYFSQHLDFNDPQMFEKTAQMLDFLSELFNVSRGNSSWSESDNNIIGMLSENIQERRGSYLLYIKTTELYKAMIDATDEDWYLDNKFVTEADNQKPYVMRPHMMRIISKELGIVVEGLSYLEQTYFLEYIKMKPASDVEHIKEFVGKYGREGLRTFLSLQHNSQLGDRLVEFGNTADENSVRMVFKKYGELMDASERVTDYLSEEFGDNTEYSLETTRTVSEKLSKEGCVVLEKFILEFEQSGGTTASESVQSSLENIKIDTITFVQAFKALKTNEAEFTIDDVKNLALSSVPFSELSKEDLERMQEMYRSNYLKYPNLAGFLVKKFEEAVKHSGGSVSLLRRKGEIVAFYRLNPTSKDNVLYFGSFNVDPTYQGALLGETLMQESLDIKAKDNIVVAECNPQVTVSANYIERGFIGVKKDHIEEIDILRIVRNDKANELLLSRQLSKESLISGEIKDPQVHVYSVPDDSISEFDFGIVGREKGGMTEILTRYFKMGDLTYLVTEDVSSDFVQKYTESQS